MLSNSSAAPGSVERPDYPLFDMATVELSTQIGRGPKISRFQRTPSVVTGLTGSGNVGGQKRTQRSERTDRLQNRFGAPRGIAGRQAIFEEQIDSMGRRGAGPGPLQRFNLQRGGAGPSPEQVASSFVFGSSPESAANTELAIDAQRDRRIFNTLQEDRARRQLGAQERANQLAALNEARKQRLNAIFEKAKLAREQQEAAKEMELAERAQQTREAAQELDEKEFRSDQVQSIFDRVQPDEDSMMAENAMGFAQNQMGELFQQRDQVNQRLRSKEAQLRQEYRNQMNQIIEAQTTSIGKLRAQEQLPNFETWAAVNSPNEFDEINRMQAQKDSLEEQLQQFQRLANRFNVGVFPGGALNLRTGQETFDRGQ